LGAEHRQNSWPGAGTGAAKRPETGAVTAKEEVQKMETKKEIGSWDQLPFKLDEEHWGKLKAVVEECPGVYYVQTGASVECFLGRELYVVTKAAIPCVISPEVAACGIEVGDVRVFEFEGPDDTYDLVDYEIMRYRVKKGLPTEKENSLYGVAVFGAERFPWYFGGMIPPRSTPFGLTVRVKKAGEGLFFLETDQCRWVLAVAFPIWSVDLTDHVKELGMIGDDDLSRRVEEARYLFFPGERCAPAIYDLLEYPEYEGLLHFIKSRQVLEAHLWKNFPEYAVEYNACNAGCYDSAKMPKNRIIYSEELAGQEFLLLP